MRHSIQLLTAALVAISVTAFAGCAPPKESTGEKVNEAIDEIQEGGDEMRQETKEAAEEVRSELKPNEDRTFGEKVEEGVEEAAEAVKESAEGLKDQADDLLKSNEKKPEAVEATEDPASEDDGKN